MFCGAVLFCDARQSKRAKCCPMHWTQPLQLMDATNVNAFFYSANSFRFISLAINLIKKMDFFFIVVLRVIKKVEKH